MYVRNKVVLSINQLYTDVSHKSLFQNISKHKGTLTNLLQLSKEEIRVFINTFDTVLTDCDGVLWVENAGLENSNHVINRLKEIHKQFFFVTNNSTKSRVDLAKKAQKLGFNCSEKDVLSTSYLSAHYLKSINFDKKVYIIGGEGIAKELDLLDIRRSDVGPDGLQSDFNTFIDEVKLDPEIGAVIIGFDPDFSYPKILKAACYLSDQRCHFIATNLDETFPSPSKLVLPGAGSMVAAIENCSFRSPFVVGKPNTYSSDMLLKLHGIKPERTLMIGDKCSTDILFGVKCGFQTMLVLSGVTRLSEVNELKKSNKIEDLQQVPDFYLNRLGDLLPHLK